MTTNNQFVCRRCRTKTEIKRIKYQDWISCGHCQAKYVESGALDKHAVSLVGASHARWSIDNRHRIVPIYSTLIGNTSYIFCGEPRELTKSIVLMSNVETSMTFRRTIFTYFAHVLADDIRYLYVVDFTKPKVISDDVITIGFLCRSIISTPIRVA